ncbi:phosphatase [Aureococcus anophagefferens]|nr:phosphatase [Aureococcus anophagefferens]
MMEPDDLVAEAAGAPGDAADDAGSWLVSALQKEPPEPHSEPQRSYWESYVGGSSSSDTLDEGGDPSPEPAASWLATYETRARAVSEFQPLAAVARLVGGDEGAPADGAWAVPSFLAGDFDDDGGGAAARRSRRSCGAWATRATTRARTATRATASSRASRRGSAAAASRRARAALPPPPEAAPRRRRRVPRARRAGRRRLGARALHRVVGVRAADDAGAGHALSLFDDRGDRREAHELAVGAAATRDALVLALEALAARERARGKRGARAALESPRRRASSRPAARDDPGGFSGRWVNDRQRSDHMGDQLLGIGIPWVIRETLLRSSNVKLISRDGLDWTEESVTTLVSKVQRLRLDGVQQEDTHPIDGSKSTRCMRLCLNLLMAAIASALAGPPSKVKLVAFDLDGTLLNTDHQLSAVTLGKLRELHALGVPLAFATGRSGPAVYEHVAALRLGARCGACYNGGVCFEFPQPCADGADARDRKTILFASPIPLDDAAAVVASRRPRAAGARGAGVGRAARGADAHPGSPPFFVELLRGDVCKGNGLKRLCELRGIDAADAVAFGDGENDVEFVSFAGVGIAMKNGRDAVKAVADRVTSSTNGEDGVARALAELQAEGLLPRE